MNMKAMKLWKIAFVKKSIGLIALFLIPRFAVGQNSVDSIVAKQDSCLQQHRLSFISKGQKMTRDISPNALKMRKFDPYKKKFDDMQLIKIIGPHIRR